MNNDPPKPLNPRQRWVVDLINSKAKGDVQAFAELTGLPRSKLSEIKHGHKDVSDKYVYRILAKVRTSPPEGISSLAAEPVADYGGTDISRLTATVNAMAAAIHRIEEQHARDMTEIRRELADLKK